MRILKSKPHCDEHYTLLMNDLNQTAKDLQYAYDNLENVIDPDMIDSCIYEVNAVQMRYKFLLTKIKQIEDSYAKNPLEVSNSCVPCVHLLCIAHQWS